MRPIQVPPGGQLLVQTLVASSQSPILLLCCGTLLLSDLRLHVFGCLLLVFEDRSELFLDPIAGRRQYLFEILQGEIGFAADVESEKSKCDLLLLAAVVVLLYAVKKEVLLFSLFGC